MQSLTSYLDGYLSAIPYLWRIAVILLVLGAAAAFSLYKRLLTKGGKAAAFLLGFAVLYISGISGFLIFLFFFISSSMLGVLIRHDRGIEKKSGARDHVQVLANGFPAVFFLLLYRFAGSNALLAAFSASVAEATADTWGGEIGRLSRRDPLSIITLTRVPKGLSGGVTALGFAASAAGALLIALLHYASFSASVLQMLSVAGCGFLGSVLDSFLGASVQVQYRTGDGALTEMSEEDGRKLERARGVPFIDNDMVNFISGMVSGGLAIAFSLV